MLAIVNPKDVFASVNSLRRDTTSVVREKRAGNPVYLPAQFLLDFLHVMSE